MKTDAKLDSIGRAQMELDNPVIDLDACQTVCGACRLVHNVHLPACPECPTT